MKTNVLRDGVTRVARRIGDFPREAALEGLICLPLIVFLASLTLVLEEQFRAFDDVVMGAVVSIKGQWDPEDVHERLSTVVIGQELFKKLLGRQLPFDKSKLVDVLRLIAAERPAAIAVDVDAIPRTTQSTAEVEQLPMFQAIRPLLEKGIDVVLVSYPSSDDAEAVSDDLWRKKYCAAAKLLNGGGKLWWASTFLQVEGHATSMIRYYSPTQARDLLNAGEALLPLGLVLAGLVDPKKVGSSPGIDYCAGPVIAPKPSEEAKHLHEIEPGAIVNYFGARPQTLTLQTSDRLPLAPQPLRFGVVVLGVESFPGVDEHVTPLGRIPGASAHALVAASVKTEKTEQQRHRMAFVVDVLVGFLFVVVFHFAMAIRDLCAEGFARARSVISTLNIAFPVLALAGMLYLALYISPRIGVCGYWVNPLPMFLGLLAHLYLDLVSAAKGRPHEASGTHHASVLRHAWARWRDRAYGVARHWRHFADAPGTLRADALVWTFGYSALCVIVIWAMWILFNSH